MATRSGHVRALVRGLDILRFVNQAGTCRVVEISDALAIPRPTVYRLLHTLEEAGYVLFSASDARVRVSPMASGLGDNSAARSHLCRVAASRLAAFTDQHQWPVDLSVYSDLRMMIEETTHWRSPVSIDAGMAGRSLPMLRSSAGRAYLAFCDPREQEIVLNLLRAEKDPEDAPFLETRWIRDRLGQFAHQGFASRGPHTFRAETSSIAVPILVDSRVVACLSVIWITSAMSIGQAAHKYADALKLLAGQVSHDMVGA